MSATTAKDPQHTRQQLLVAAADEIHEHGFQAASLDRILSKTKLTKGALYHHFPSKQVLGLAVVDEVIGDEIQRCRIDALLASDGDPFENMLTVAHREFERHTEQGKPWGCPLNNLVQEMSPLDAQFREHLQTIVERWQAAIVETLRRGQARNYVRKDVDCESVAWFILAVHCGILALLKIVDRQLLVAAAFQQAGLYFKGLKP